ncbi:MAG: hypothetical protein A3B96_02615 [Candidatus Spechtbacteria bacterium RIFCSPHIGHO2_02_FULL_43_15b]|uniref:Mannosylglycerate hydrolase MGH1-like glycoside hydrolase domain-containing protein n=1 Tax=Candidatus Spechtbacteria bacterium RIFCSPHIGHO2_01_FULL_43_30 TaxID=1802158 RepID=A0A1G2H6M8_9BACT|nr:MAG: hypothetical protein A2827_02770 [Candidatus Spechtbacteria bacterium RIFCSPHIGHO2_01_FULL_43_30]OGZ60191.1 MAG: hypothetical protein A3B96_02615 [Candidatus Spechtbacteria bacterium RIFCSPHIGHO2_02_FULL_43_15b]
MTFFPFGDPPKLDCQNPYFQNFYNYRWKNLEDLSFDFSKRKQEAKYLPAPGVYEGTSFFQQHISYSAQAHMRELRWLENPLLAQGSIVNFIENQAADGSLPGHINPEKGANPETFYHADWGTSVLEVYWLHPDRDFLLYCYNGLSRYAEYFERQRDRERFYMYDIVNHFETGQEFSPRYSTVSDKADSVGWGNVFCLKGVDATVYIYQLYESLRKMAQLLGGTASAEAWSRRAQKVKHAVLKYMWDPVQEMFFDFDANQMRRTDVKALTCFYPYFTNIVSKKHLAGFKKHLFNSEEFFTPVPFPTLSMDDPQFSADGIWKGKKEMCPWNGRMWPMTNSHIAEAIANLAIRFDDNRLRREFVSFFEKWLATMSFEGDPLRPNSFEHYHPLKRYSASTTENGFNGIDNYLHSWINDLIIKYVVGIRPYAPNMAIMNPFPFNAHTVLENLIVNSRDILVLVEPGSFRVYIDKKPVAFSANGTPLQIALY